MAAINDLIDQIQDVTLRNRILQEVSKLQKQRKFGLVYEEHIPEATLLYDVPIRKGIKVVLRDGKIGDCYRVQKIEGNNAICSRIDESTELVTLDKNNLVAVAHFGEPIFPYLEYKDSICNAPDSDLWHTLIEADNYHALQLLVYLYGGKVDCIYIDPPYNTGAKDWKYNNNYVDGADSYRHSKWLSMMEKRLKLAKKLLNPKDSVLIVTIDEKEYLHLGCLLEQMFPEAEITMVSSLINPAGTGAKGNFGRTNEFIFFVMIGSCVVSPQEIIDVEGQEVSWDSLRRHNPSNLRPTRPSQFYPIYIDIKTSKIVKVGDPITPDVDRFSIPSLDGCETVFPVKDDGTEMMWGILPSECKRRLQKGYVKVGKYSPEKPQQYSLQFLTSGTIAAIENGEAIITGHRKDGSVIAVYNSKKKILPKTQWAKESHDATRYGTKMLTEILGKRFNYPKSLYAVADCLRYFVANNPNALILDFFAGSGTTMHAVNLLNTEDDGKRRCILVTNNEVSDEEAKDLTAKGYKQGDDEWEKLGIANYVTWQRTKCSILGQDINGNPLKGNYISSNLPMSDGFKANASFFKLGFLDKTSVSLGRQLRELIPVLWMKAGAIGECPSIKGNEDIAIFSSNKFALLVNESEYSTFEAELNNHPEIEVVYIITNSEAGYREMIANLKVKQTYQLYRDYLDNFSINYSK